MLPALPDLLAELVRLPSINPMGRTDLPVELCFESRVTDYLESLLRGLDVPYERQAVAPGRSNLVAQFRPANAMGHILWEAHQDTVPVDGMVIDPFAGTIRDKKLYGRGACDVKAGIACMLTAFARLVREKPAGSLAITLAFTVDEEHTFLGVEHLVAAGVRAEGAIVAEPTGLNIVSTHKGVVRWTLETEGVACHSSRPDRGINAVYRMAHLVRALEAHAQKLPRESNDPVLGPATLSVGVIQGGVSPNTVPDLCRIEIDRRLLPGEDPEEARTRLEMILRQDSTIDFPFQIQTRLACPALCPTGSARLIQSLGQAIDAVVGHHEVVGVPYGTDASTLAAAGIPSVVFGPGDIAQAHTKDEWVDLDQVELAAEILFQFARRGEWPTLSMSGF